MRLGKYEITADKHQFILSEVSIVKDEKSKSFGDEIFTNKKFYATMSQLISGLQKNESRECLNASNSFEELVILLEKQHATIMLYIKECK